MGNEEDRVLISEIAIDAIEVKADVFVIPMERLLIDTTGGDSCRRFLTRWSKGRVWLDGKELELNSARVFSWGNLAIEPSVVFVNVPIATEFSARFKEELTCCFANVIKEASSCSNQIRSIAIPHLPKPPDVDDRTVANVAVSSAVKALRERMLDIEITFYCGSEHVSRIYSEAKDGCKC